MLSYIYGIKTSDACRRFVGQFEPCYYYRGVYGVQRPSNRPFERGALVLRSYQGAWMAYAHAGARGGFRPLKQFEQSPSREQLAELKW